MCPSKEQQPDDMGQIRGGRGDNGVIRAWLLAPSSQEPEQMRLDIFHGNQGRGGGIAEKIL